MKSLCILMMALPLALAGCDRYTETHTKTTTDDRGTVKQEEKKTRVDNQGNTVTEEHKEKRATDAR